jgi:pimeloyl-ACP methyl ester carboxylesterase
MPKVTHAFYIPGLGNPRNKGQGLLLKVWRIYGVRIHYYPMYWSDKRSFSEKFEALLEAIDATAKKTGSVSLIGTSAGASAVINAYAARRQIIHRVVCISGKLNNPQTAENRFKENPSFEGSLRMVATSLAALNVTDRSRILSLHPVYDDVVPINDTRIEGAHEGLEPVVGHVASIIYALTLGSYRICRFLKSY